MANENYRLKVGAFDCVVVSDGTFAYHEPASIFFPNAPGEQIDRALRAHGLEPGHWHEQVSPYTGLLVHTGRHRVLVDTGAGGLAPTTGRLLQNLRAEGVAPGEIDVVLLSHAHPDHLGGFLDADGRPAFPNARYVMAQDEWKFWTSGPTLAEMAVSDFIKNIILSFAREKLPPVRDQLELITRETEVVPGVWAIPAPGHTPGHLAVAVVSGKRQLLYTADAVLHPIALEHPDWLAVVDIAPDDVVATRRRLFDRADADEALVHSFHFPFPCLGHVERHDQAWRWHPL